jgi:hypothetical protein
MVSCMATYSIRGFNTVFSDVKDKGWLIDFDFDKETTVFPRGYNCKLVDGLRYGGERLIKKYKF